MFCHGRSDLKQPEKPKRHTYWQFPAVLHSPIQTLMRSEQIKRGEEEEKGNSLRPQGRPNPIIPITLLNHTLMMGIKMCWPRSTPTPQPSAAECIWSRAVAAGKGECEGVCYLRGSAQQYGRV